MFFGAELWFNPPVFYGGGWGDWATPELCAAKPCQEAAFPNSMAHIAFLISQAAGKSGHSTYVERRTSRRP
ncbi:hypothetical protein, partial [Thermincola ferriacetica]